MPPIGGGARLKEPDPEDQPLPGAGAKQAEAYLAQPAGSDLLAARRLKASPTPGHTPLIAERFAGHSLSQSNALTTASYKTSRSFK